MALINALYKNYYLYLLSHHVAGLTEGFTLQGKEGVSTQFGVAGITGEAVNVVHLVHSSATAVISNNLLTTSGADSCKVLQNNLDR